MAEAERTLESNAADVVKSQRALDDLETDQRKLTLFEENVTNWFGDSVQSLQQLEIYQLSARDQDTVSRILSEVRQHSYRFQAGIDDKRTRLKKEMQTENERLDSLYHERRRLLETEANENEGV